MLLKFPITLLVLLAFDASAGEILNCELGQSKSSLAEGPCYLYGNFSRSPAAPRIPKTVPTGSQLLLESFAISRGFTSEISLEGCQALDPQKGGDCVASSIKVSIGSQSGILMVKALLRLRPDRYGKETVKAIADDAHSAVVSKAICKHLGMAWNKQIEKLQVAQPTSFLRTSPYLGSYYRIFLYPRERTERWLGTTKVSQGLTFVYPRSQSLEQAEVRSLVGSESEKTLFTEGSVTGALQDGSVVLMPVNKVTCVPRRKD